MNMIQSSNKYSLFIPESHLTSSDLQVSGPGAFLFFSTVKTASSSRGANGESSMLLLLNASEGPPTLQSTVIPAWNYAPQLLGKVTPTFSPIVNAARK